MKGLLEIDGTLHFLEAVLDCMQVFASLLLSVLRHSIHHLHIQHCFQDLVSQSW